MVNNYREVDEEVGFGMALTTRIQESEDQKERVGICDN
jgi:hypothetical protein